MWLYHCLVFAESILLECFSSLCRHHLLTGLCSCLSGIGKQSSMTLLCLNWLGHHLKSSGSAHLKSSDLCFLGASSFLLSSFFLVMEARRSGLCNCCGCGQGNYFGIINNGRGQNGYQTYIHQVWSEKVQILQMCHER